MAVMLTGLALMAFMPEASAQASRTVKKKEATSVTKPAPEKSKSVTRTAPASRNVKPQAQKPQTQKPQTQKPQPQKPDNKPQKPETRPQKPPQQPSRPAPRPDNDRHDRPGDNMRPGNRPPAQGPQRPSGRPDHYRPGRPSIVPGRPPRPRPRPIIAPVPIFRPPHGVVIAINISPNKLRLKKARLYDDVDYFYEDGLFYANHNELVGQFNNGKTAVANNEQIIEGIAGGVASANEEQNTLLREGVRLLRRLLEKDSTIDVSTIATAFNRKNQRDGKVTVPVSI